MNNKTNDMGVNLVAVATSTTLMQAAVSAKEFLDGAYLCVSISNYHADSLALNSFLSDNMDYSSAAVPHKDFIFANESDSAVYRVNSIFKSTSSFLYEVEFGKDAYTFLIEYRWNEASAGSGSVLIEGKSGPIKKTFSFYKREYVTEKGGTFRVSVFATGGFLQITVLPPSIS